MFSQCVSNVYTCGEEVDWSISTIIASMFLIACCVRVDTLGTQ
jgi:hypothetical protein